MEFEFAYHDYHFVFKYYDTFFTYNIWFSLSCRNSNHIFLSSILKFCPFNNRFAFHNYLFAPVYYDDLIKGTKENQKEFDLYMKKNQIQNISIFYRNINHEI